MVDTEDWNRLARLDWPRLIRAGAQGLDFKVRRAFQDSWVAVTKDAEAPAWTQDPDMIRSYYYAQTALEEAHKRIWWLRFDKKAASTGADAKALAALHPLAEVLLDNVVQIGSKPRAAPLDDLKQPYRIALAEVLLGLEPREVIAMGAIND